MDRNSQIKNVIFSAILILIVLVFTELFASEALLFRMRLSNEENFSKLELSYSSVVNIIHKVGIKAGVFPDPYQVRLKWEPELHRAVDPELGYRELPGQYQVTYSRTVARNGWEHLRLRQTTNRDGTRWTGAFDPDYKGTVYIFGDSFVHGEGVNDEQTFSALFQRSRPDLRVRLFALPGWGMVQAYVNFSRIRSEIRPEDTIVIGYADFFDVRTVVAPSRLREGDEWFKKLGRPTEEVLLPKVGLSSDGRIEISLVQQACSINKSYCQQSDPPKLEMARITAELMNYIARNTEARTFVLHFTGDPNNPIFDMLDSRITRISALENDFDYFIRDNVAGFDPHPGPYWHYAISRKLIEALAEKRE